jgi:hypothetical protein
VSGPLLYAGCQAFRCPDLDGLVLALRVLARGRPMTFRPVTAGRVHDGAPAVKCTFPDGEWFATAIGPAPEDLARAFPLGPRRLEAA